jgi:hypothetical protein
MLVFGTKLTIVTFLISLFELVFFFYQIVYYLSRPSDKNRLYYLILLYLLIQHNIVGGLLPDKNIPINLIVQNILAYLVAFAMGMYFPFYFYKVKLPILSVVVLSIRTVSRNKSKDAPGK